MRRSRFFFYIFSTVIFFALFFYFLINSDSYSIDRSGEKQLLFAYEKKLIEKKESFEDVVENSSDCLAFEVDYSGTVCNEINGNFRHCLDTFSNNFLVAPQCARWDVEHMETPESVKSIYMSAYVAGNKTFREKLFTLIDETELNSVIIDVKEVDGLLTSREYENIFPNTKVEQRIPDLKKLLADLAERDIYTIARIVVFKDAHMVEQYPEWAVLKKSNPDEVWKDYGGKKYIDPGAQEAWDYIIDLADRSYAIGFDEINLDYIRFPSDGNMDDTYYPFSQESINADPVMARSDILEEFAKYFHKNLRDKHPNVVTSADVFGMVTTNKDDLTIGQLLEPYLEHYDYVAPMVYPSHYPNNYLGLPGHPDNYPYEVVNHSMKVAVDRAGKMGAEYPDKLRPWLQDFTCTWCRGAGVYGADQVRAQIDATYDAGLDSWFLWDAGNTYTRGALENNN